MGLVLIVDALGVVIYFKKREGCAVKKIGHCDPWANVFRVSLLNLLSFTKKKKDFMRKETRHGCGHVSTIPPVHIRGLDWVWVEEVPLEWDWFLC